MSLFRRTLRMVGMPLFSTRSNTRVVVMLGMRPFSSEATSKENVGGGANGKAEGNANSGNQSDGKLLDAAALKAQVDELTSKTAELKDLLLRQMAETENVRKIGQEQIENAKKYGLQSLVKDLIQVFDTMEIALSEVKGAREKAEELQDFHQAVLALEKDMMKIFSKHGFERFHPEEGHDFNPQQHDALFVVPAESKEKHHKVATVVRKGFSLHGRVIRPSQVGVTKHQ